MFSPTGETLLRARGEQQSGKQGKISGHGEIHGQSVPHYGSKTVKADTLVDGGVDKHKSTLGNHENDRQLYKYGYE